ncbi:MAG: hypothetical protein V4735_09060 [Pseudomonadota bacterium]
MPVITLEPSDAPPEPNARRYPDVIPSIHELLSIVSFDKIQRDGALDQFTSGKDTIRFDTSANDPVATEYRQIREALKASIQDDWLLKTLPPGSQQGDYEQRLAYLVTDSIRDTTFSARNYRQAQDGGSTSRNLNQLTDQDEYDCEHLVYIRGLLMQEGDQYAVAQGLRTQSTQFYAIPGTMLTDPLFNQDILQGHIFIASAATGNIVEATDRGTGYYGTNRHFDEIIAGYPMVANNSIYAPSAYNADLEAAAQRLSVIQKTPEHLDTLGAMRQRVLNIPNPFAKNSLGEALWYSNQLSTRALDFESQCASTMLVMTTDGAAIIAESGAALEAGQLLVDQKCTSKAVLHEQKERAVDSIKKWLFPEKLTFSDVPKEKESAEKEPARISILPPNPDAAIER